MYLQLHICLPIYTLPEINTAPEKMVKGKVTFQPSIFAILVSDTFSNPQKPKRQSFRPSIYGTIYGLWRFDPTTQMKETLGFSWWPLQSPPRPPLAMAAGRGRRGGETCHWPFFWGVPDGKTCRQAIFEGVYTLQGTDTYPTNREVRKSIESSKVPFWWDMVVPRRVNPYYTQLGGDFIFTHTWGNDPIWRAYFSDGLNPPTSRTWPLSWVFIDIEWGFSWIFFAGNLSFT